MDNFIYGTRLISYMVNFIEGDEESANNDNDRYQHSKTDNRSHRSSLPNYQGRPSYNNYHGRTFFNRHRNDIFEQVILIRSDCVSRIVGNFFYFSKKYILFILIIIFMY